LTADITSSSYWDECELVTLYRTLRVGDPGIELIDPTYPVKAVDIADKIIERRAHKPFSSWQDFNKFIDGLVGSVIRDNRPDSYFTTPEGPLGGSSYDNLQTPMQTLYTSQAIADVIKANANPNLHLNEINPNAEIWQWVDKTDLIKNSTEFCFIPTGVFEIESLGMVLKPQPDTSNGEPNDSLRVQNLLRGKRKILTEVKLYDIYRETSQRDFYRGDFGDYTHISIPTNNMRPVETGPEPDQGLGPYENNYEGYITLSTRGGWMDTATNLPKEKGKVVRRDNPPSGRGLASRMYGHFDLDFRLHNSSSGKIKPLTEEPIGGMITSNEWNERQDRTENSSNYTSPYCLAYNPMRYRIARSFVYDNDIQGLSVNLYAPNDHRIDGAYCERLSSLPFYSSGYNKSLDPPYLNSDKTPYRDNAGVNIYNGSISYWIKPNFFPEYNSQIRAFADMSCKNSTYFTNYFLWGTYSSSSPVPLEDFNYSGASWAMDSVTSLQRPVTLSFAIQGPEYYAGRPYSNKKINDFYGILCTTPTLNHKGHIIGGWTGNWHKVPAYFDLFNAHKWIHITFSWGMDSENAISWERDTGKEKGAGTIDDKPDGNWYCKILINGRVLTQQYHTYYYYANSYSDYYYFDVVFVDWDKVAKMPVMRPNPLYIGGGNKSKVSNKFYNAKADATIDELYVWDKFIEDPAAFIGTGRTIRETVRDDHWGVGRYYSGDDSIFSSGSIDFGKLRWKTGKLPSAGGDSYPGGYPRVVSGVDLSCQGSNSPLILGMSWTAYVDDIKDYYNPLAPNPVQTECNLWLSLYDGVNWNDINGVPMKKDGWQWVWRQTNEQNLLRYKIKFYLDFKDEDERANAILLESPIFDDFTIYYKGGKIEFLTWVLV
jgi:hypothetical protein